MCRNRQPPKRSSLLRCPEFYHDATAGYKVVPNSPAIDYLEDQCSPINKTNSGLLDLSPPRRARTTWHARFYRTSSFSNDRRASGGMSIDLPVPGSTYTCVIVPYAAAASVTFARGLSSGSSAVWGRAKRATAQVTLDRPRRDTEQATTNWSGYETDDRKEMLELTIRHRGCPPARSFSATPHPNKAEIVLELYFGR
jgi:hypothetical protein